MASESAAHEGRNTMLEKGYLAICVLLFTWGVLSWRGLVGGDRPWEPVRFIALTGAMLLQALAAFVRTRSRRLFWSLLLASLIGLGLTLVVRF